MAFWGLEIKRGKPLPLNIERRLVVKQAALAIEKPSNEPCVLSVSVGGTSMEYVVCRLREGKQEHCTLELPFSPSDNAVLHLKGPHTLHLTGFLDILVLSTGAYFQMDPMHRLWHLDEYLALHFGDCLETFARALAAEADTAAS